MRQTMRGRSDSWLKRDAVKWPPGFEAFRTRGVESVEGEVTGSEMKSCGAETRVASLLPEPSCCLSRLQMPATGARLNHQDGVAFIDMAQPSVGRSVQAASSVMHPRSDGSAAKSRLQLHSATVVSYATTHPCQELPSWVFSRR
jgi:hypothetical protein